METYRVVFFGDIVGALGRQALVKVLPELKARFKPYLTIANAENLAHGAGITEKTLTELSNGGIDVFTGGNHSWNNPLGVPLFEDERWKDRLVAPMNCGEAKSGHSWTIWKADGVSVLIINLMGRLFMHPSTSSPFTALDTILSEHVDKTPQAVVIDFHAEATSEKEAFGHYADGRVAAVLGTHTHVATADAKILPGGTAFVTDVGRCGAYDSVIGFEKKAAIKGFLSNTDNEYEIPREGQAEINGIAITVDIKTGKTLTLDRIREIVAI